MKRKNTEIIADRAAALARFANCGPLAEKAASTYSAALYNEGSSGANAICQGYKLAKRWKAHNIGSVRDNRPSLRQRYSQFYQSV